MRKKYIYYLDISWNFGGGCLTKVGSSVPGGSMVSWLKSEALGSRRVAFECKLYFF